MILLDVIVGDLLPGGRLDEQDLARRYGAGLAGVRDASWPPGPGGSCRATASAPAPASRRWIWSRSVVPSRLAA